MRTQQRGFSQRICVGVACAVLFELGVTNAHARQYFNTPDAAMVAFGQAVLDNNEPAMKDMLGADFRDIIPPVGTEIRDKFIKAWGVAHTIQKSDSHAFIAVGDDGWTSPVPLVKSARGWQFDTLAGAKEMRLRRIGRNELAVIQTLQAICDAQDEYAETPHDGDKMMVYASKLSSSPGKHDGLYWPTAPGESQSPLGPAFEGAGTQNESKDGYYGYHYKLLTAQGPNAPGGAMNYVLDGKLFAGFAVTAWPVRYGDTGVMSFIVNHTGQVYERDLGPNIAAKAAATKSFDPAHGWRKVSP
ncbi:DUF2950 domain-containing protein [Paraburkholderia sp. BL10I2N1]|uniref:DUF2950 domain-containing protein n=1 Tax=Paraburkholderia sp. BL10I2N1 TaxID=1938796 RepID=UPI001060CBA2|nr:DUF2950 domain-containing protein [Paraburkholderia sp. BL10I2N1]TDN69731.1 DUF2950 family protein [Paraburkholderia sp. BL10I2N1]